MKERLTRFVPGGLLVVAVALAFGRVLLSGWTLMFRDHREVFRDRWWWVVESLSHGVLPARTLASDTTGVLERLLNATYTPMTGLFFLFEFDFAYDLFVAAHVALLSLGLYVLARSLGADRVSAAAAGAFGLSGPFLSYENFVVNLQAIAWTPWVLWAVRGVFVAPSWRWVGATALFIGFHLQGIMPELALLDVVAGALLVAFLRGDGHRLDGRRAALLGVSGVLGFAIAAVELMPVLSSLSTTARGAGFGSEEASVWSLHPLGLLDVALPSFFHDANVPYVVFPEILNAANIQPYLCSLYLGVGVPLAVAAAFSADRRVRRFAFVLLGLAVFFTVAAFGRRFWLYEALHALPILENGRYPVKMFLIATACLAALAPAGMHVIQTRPRAALVFAPGPILALIVSRVVTLPELVEVVGAHLAMHPVLGAPFGLTPAAYPSAAVETMSSSAIHGLVFGGIALVVAVLASRQPRLAGLMLLVMLADFASAARRQIVAVENVPPNAALAEVLADPYYRMYVRAPGGRRAPVEVREGESPKGALLRDERARGGALYGWYRAFNDPDNEGQSNRASTRMFKALQRSRGAEGPAIVARAGVRKMSSFVPSKGATRYEVDGIVPQWVETLPSRRYAEVHPRWVVMPLETSPVAEAIAVFTDPTQRDVAVVTSEGAPVAPVLTASVAVACVRSSTVTWTGGDRIETLDVITVEVQSACDALVSVMEVKQPGWEVRLDGAMVEPLEVDMGFMAVRVTPGRHEVRLEYVGDSRRWIWISGAAALLAGVLVFTRRRPRPGLS